jgi:hypothetical protein
MSGLRINECYGELRPDDPVQIGIARQGLYGPAHPASPPQVITVAETG